MLETKALLTLPFLENSYIHLENKALLKTISQPFFFIWNKQLSRLKVWLFPIFLQIQKNEFTIV